ncbi:MerR family transcriptional regulator [Oceanobacillus jeddahense]|uniref:MerR family transcriptional regulator n=1 Tax=Oceanobacillus jeddahense TaxID=1462527 RepID=A0ABY5JVU5_9BACI|nr:MerR family transcriptional regulator [Oceanobacillus jeddahense]UUI04502.1 MerR family transcriptional regulator [Oceanobacillus jeddahense]
MKKPYYTVKDVIVITGVTKRTLHYYDEINLLKPESYSDKGYRLYNQEDLKKLRTILMLKELDLPLKEIATIMQMPKQEQQAILAGHYQAVQIKKQNLERTLMNLEDFISGKDISYLDIFHEGNILPLKEQYHAEAKYVYGDTAKYQEYEKNMEQIPEEERAAVFEAFDQNMQDVFKQFAKLSKESPASEKVQQIVREWKSYLEQFMVCDTEILQCIAYTYKDDEGFKAYINQFGDDKLNEFIHQAIMCYCKNERLSHVENK